jgi:cell division transport system ATP-binding protein
MSKNADRQTPEAADAQASPIVRFDQVRGSGDETALRGLSFALAPGSFQVIAGPVGAGKTEVLRLISLAARPAAGVVQVFGRDVATLSSREAALVRRRIGAVFYPLRFIDHLSVWDNAALGPRVVGRRPADYGQEVAAILKWTGLFRRAADRPGDLTPAERHRLALARALANRPELLVVDEPSEPFEAADTLRGQKLLDEIWRAGATVIAASRNEASATGRPVLRLHEGRGILVEPRES